MSTPGVSLFQGAESIQVNNSIDRAEEEEALEDQRRRNEELGNLLQNAFDDLEDDDTTIDSTSNFQVDLVENHNNNNHQHDVLVGNGKEIIMNAAFEAEMHQLKMLIESRTNEMEHFKQLAAEEHKQRNDLYKRLSIVEAELDRALTAKNNQHELLVESKEKCSNLENTIAKLRSEKKALEAENNTVLGKLETAQTLLGDVQRKYDMVERDLNKHNARSEELRRKQLEERHRAEIEMMQQQMDTLTDKLEKKQSEYEHMSTRYHALQSSHELMLVEKSSRINELTGALSEAQEKCEQLLSKGDYFQENVRLQKLVAHLQEQIRSMEQTINALNGRLESTTAELDVMDSLLHQHNLDDSKAGAGVVGSTPLGNTDRGVSLKNELFRALANVKSKRDELRKLQARLDKQTLEVRTLRAEENKSLVQINTLKEENIRLENRVKLLEQELEELQHAGSTSQAMEDLEKQLQAQLAQLEASLEQQLAERNQLIGQLRNVEVDLEELRQEHDNLKRNHKQMQQANQEAEGWRLDLERHKFLLSDAQAECSRLKKLYVEIANSKEALEYELEKLRQADSAKELQEQRDKVAALQRALQLAEVKASELSKLLEHEKQSREQEINALREKQRGLDLKESKNNENVDCTRCLTYLAEITKVEVQNLKLTNINSLCKQQVDDLTQQLAEAHTSIGTLREQLKLSKQQEQLISELKTKAHKFEQYIRTSQSGSSPEKSLNSPPQANNNSNNDDGGDKNNDGNEDQEKEKKISPTIAQADKELVKKLEARMRIEISQMFANELKRFQVKLFETEEQLHRLRREHQHIMGELKQRELEVDVLKQAILAERERMVEILQEKQLECVEVVAKHDAMLQRSRDELKTKSEKLNEVLVELKERQEQIEAERQSMKAVMCQWEAQRQNIDALETEWKAKIKNLKHEHEEAINSWQKKYNSAKRTAANYKVSAHDHS